MNQDILFFCLYSLDSIFGEGFTNTYVDEGMKEFTKEVSNCSDPQFLEVLSMSLDRLDGTAVKDITNSFDVEVRNLMEQCRTEKDFKRIKSLGLDLVFSTMWVSYLNTIR